MCKGFDGKGPVGVLSSKRGHPIKPYRVNFVGDERVAEKDRTVGRCSSCRGYANEKDLTFVNNLEKNNLLQSMVLVTA